MDRTMMKRLMPPAVKTTLAHLRDRLNGPGIEYSVLREYNFRADESPVPRINFILPGLALADAFGGVMSGLNFFDGLVQSLAPDGVEARIITEQPVAPGDNAAGKYPTLAACDQCALETAGYVLPTRIRDIFLVFNWWISLNLEPVLAAQARHFRRKPRPKLHLIQEYEPHFYEFSAAHLLAREAMGESWPLWAIFNTEELHAFWLAQGHRAEKTYVFEPRMNARLRPYANELSSDEKTRTVLVYGRPQVPRNAFYLVRSGLEHWARRYGAGHKDWRMVSAGMTHEDIDLGGGHSLKSLGKLSLDEYGRLLRQTAVGLSLMASPHPSYPPLEMAHFGARVLTNSYPGKCPSVRHENLVALPGVRGQPIAEALEAEIVSFLADPTVGLRGKSHMPDYLGDDRIECVGAVSADIRTELGISSA